MNLESLAKRIGRATRLQLALGGVWENSWILKPNDEQPSENALQIWLTGSDDFAFEVFFSDVGFGESFLGVRLRDLAITSKIRLIQQVHARLCNSRFAPQLPDVKALLESHLKIELFAEPCDFLEIGVCNLWKSVGAHRLWSRGETPESRASLTGRFRDRAPQLLDPQPMPIMAECAVSAPMAHWLGLTVSVEKSALHVLEVAVVADMLNLASVEHGVTVDEQALEHGEAQ